MRKLFFISLLGILLFQPMEAQRGKLMKGDMMPPFSLTNQDGKVFNSRDYTGRHVLVVYFYPKDESTVCTKEACSFRDSFDEFNHLGAMVIGINAGSVASHKNFQLHHRLPFILLSDPGNKVLKEFGVKTKFFITGRETFVVDLSGKIVFTFNSFSQGERHMTESLAVVKGLKKE